MAKSTGEGYAGEMYDRGVIKTAQLRVYLPSSDPLPATRSPSLRTRLAPAGRYGLTCESPVEDAIHAEWGGRWYRCPRTHRLRMLEGVLALHQAFGSMGAAPVIPEDVARLARLELETLHRSSPDVRTHILTSAWHVPVRWFVPFAPEAKEIVEVAEGRTIRYRVDLPRALHNLTRAMSIMAEAGLPLAIVEEVDELEAWLSGFPTEAMVELDYGSVATLFSDADLVMDDSVEDVWASLEALAADDWEEAGERYGSIVAHWAPAVAVGSSS